LFTPRCEGPLLRAFRRGDPWVARRDSPSRAVAHVPFALLLRELT